ncbi:Rho GTPase activation protein [Lactarius deliciosus]|nr:Rho GTPase activation protein [Lactarius deliciosus]
MDALFDILPHGVNTVLYYRTVRHRVWEKPDGFVIPLTVLRNTALGHRLSKSFPSTTDQSPPPHAAGQQPRPVVHHPHSYRKEDAAFNPSTFGEPLDAVFRLQERTYPTQWVPIVLSFLADGVLALGEEMRLDRGSYTLEGVKDPLVPALLFKLWLRELIDPLVPSEMYNDCIAFAGDAEACCAAVERLPTAKRRVMTSANLALVMAPNLLRCGSDSMAIVFNNAQYEQVFVYNLLLHLNCSEIDAQYVPQHGLARSPPPSSGIEITKSPRTLLSVLLESTALCSIISVSSFIFLVAFDTTQIQIHAYKSREYYFRS